jgi:hypothetical protein
MDSIMKKKDIKKLEWTYRGGVSTIENDQDLINNAIKNLEEKISYIKLIVPKHILEKIQSK